MFWFVYVFSGWYRSMGIFCIACLCNERTFIYKWLLLFILRINYYDWPTAVFLHNVRYNLKSFSPIYMCWLLRELLGCVCWWIRGESIFLIVTLPVTHLTGTTGNFQSLNCRYFQKCLKFDSQLVKIGAGTHEASRVIIICKIWRHICGHSKMKS